MGLTDELARLGEMRRDGVLTDEEFARAKAALLTAPPDVSGPPPIPPRARVDADTRHGAAPAGRTASAPPPLPRDEPSAPEARARSERQWAMYIHFSVLAGLLVPLAGFLLPIVLWQTRREELPGVEAHGKIVANWLLSALIYGIASGVLVFALVGIPMLVALGVLSIVFPVLGGVRAGEGVAWPYPLSIRFFR